MCCFCLHQLLLFEILDTKVLCQKFTMGQPYKNIVLKIQNKMTCIKILRIYDGVTCTQKNILDEKQFLIKIELEYKFFPTRENYCKSFFRKYIYLYFYDIFFNSKFFFSQVFFFFYIIIISSFYCNRLSQTISTPSQSRKTNIKSI